MIKLKVKHNNIVPFVRVGKVLWADIKFSNPIVSHFIKVFKKEGILKKEKEKNIYLAKQFYYKLQKQELKYEFPEGVDIDKFYKELMQVDFWKNIIDFIHNYADDNILKFYTQTVNGVFGFYFKHYHRLKKVVGGQTLSSEDRMYLSQVRRWNRQDVINCFHCWIAKLYKAQTPIFKCSPNQDFYRYVKFISYTTPLPIIKPIIIENNQLIRGLIFSFLDKLVEFGELKSFEVSQIVDIEKFKIMCEQRGIEVAEDVTNKDLDDIVADALYRFFDTKCLQEYLKG
jgi:hypothetical protein